MILAYWCVEDKNMNAEKHPVNEYGRPFRLRQNDVVMLLQFGLATVALVTSSSAVCVAGVKKDRVFKPRFGEEAVQRGRTVRRKISNHDAR